MVLKFEGELLSNGFDPTYLMFDSTMTMHECKACQTQFATLLHFRQCLPQFTVALTQAFCIVSVVVGYAAGLKVECRRSCDKMTLWRRMVPRSAWSRWPTWRLVLPRSTLGRLSGSCSSARSCWVSRMLARMVWRWEFATTSTMPAM